MQLSMLTRGCKSCQLPRDENVISVGLLLRMRRLVWQVQIQFSSLVPKATHSFQQTSVTRVEMLAWATAYKLVHSLLRQLHDKLPPCEHGENVSTYIRDRVGTEHFAASNVPALGQRVNHRLELRVDANFCLFCRCFLGLLDGHSLIAVVFQGALFVESPTVHASLERMHDPQRSMRSAW
jgi:hypothetical protein